MIDPRDIVSAVERFCVESGDVPQADWRNRRHGPSMGDAIEGAVIILRAMGVPIRELEIDDFDEQ